MSESRLSSAAGSAVLFLDIDGVLNQCGQSNDGFDPEKVTLLKQILDATKARVVLSSTWRKFGRRLGQACAMLEDIGHVLEDATPVLDSRTSGAWGSPIWIAPKRCDEILAWLAKNGMPANFVVLDDDSDAGDSTLLKRRFVQTDSFVGLTPEIAGRVIGLLNPEPPTRETASERAGE